MRKFAYILFVVLAVALTSCREGCYQPSRSLLGVAFVDSNSRKPVTVQGVSVQGVGVDSIIYNNVNVNAVYLPLHLEKDTTLYQFSFRYENDMVIKDTLMVVHKLNAQFVSPACGCVPTFEIKEIGVTGDDLLIKDIEIYNGDVINVEQQVNVKIYL